MNTRKNKKEASEGLSDMDHGRIEENQLTELEIAFYIIHALHQIKHPNKADWGCTIEMIKEWFDEPHRGLTGQISQDTIKDVCEKMQSNMLLITRRSRMLDRVIVGYDWGFRKPN